MVLKKPANYWMSWRRREHLSETDKDCTSNYIKRRILKNLEIQKSLLKEKLLHDIIAVKTDT